MESSSIESIFRVVDQLKSTAERIQTKVVDVSKKVHKFKQNALLDADCLYLSFQMALLNNEKTYYTGLAKLIEDKIYSDLVRIYEKILMLITSLETLDIEHDEEKNNIIQGVRKTQRVEIISCPDVINLASCSVSNLELVKRFIELFKLYIQKLETENRRENIHCANLTLTLSMRKRHIEVEYQKYREQLQDLFAYFGDCTAAISKQLGHQEGLLFLIDGVSSDEALSVA